MWNTLLTVFCTGALVAWLYAYFSKLKAAHDEKHAVKVLEKVVWWIFERRSLNDEEKDALLLEAVACGCDLGDLLERRMVLFGNEKRFPPGVPYKQFGLKIAYLYPYLPSDRQLLEEDRKIAERIYRFKQGMYIPGLLDEFCSMFENMGLKKSEYMLLCIPASDMVRTETRYRRFSKDLASKMNWIDGFGSLVPIGREPVHITGCRKILVEEDFIMDKKRLKGCRIVLLDDLLTTGLMVISISRILRKVGAKPVAAIFVGRTLEKPVSWKALLPEWAGVRN